MKTLENIIAILSVPLILLNVFGGLVSGIWLIVLKQWSPLLSGILCFLVSNILLCIVLVPGMLFMMPVAFFSDKRWKFLATIFYALSCIYILALITAWCSGVLFYFIIPADKSTLIPLLIWSYGVAIGPWQYLASKDPDSYGSAIVTFFAQLAYFTVIMLILFTPITMLGTILVFAGFMFFTLLLQLIIWGFIQKENTEQNQSSEPT